MSLPDFTGTWRSCGSENIEAFLIAQGIPAANVERAVKFNQSIKQSIKQTDDSFTVTVNDVTTVYSIINRPASIAASNNQSNNEDEEPAGAESIAAMLTNNTMGWVTLDHSIDQSNNETSSQSTEQSISQSKPEDWKLIVLMLSEGRSTERRLVDQKMMIVNEINGVRAVNWFERDD